MRKQDNFDFFERDVKDVDYTLDTFDNGTALLEYFSFEYNVVKNSSFDSSFFIPRNWTSYPFLKKISL